jgi:hypothetical protein
MMAYSNNRHSSEKLSLEENYASRLHRMSRSSFQKDAEQRVLIKYVRFKRVKLFYIYRELIFTFGEERATHASAKHRFHEIQRRPTIFGDEDRAEKLPIDHIDMPILKSLDEIHFSLIKFSNAELGIRKVACDID